MMLYIGYHIMQSDRDVLQEISIEELRQKIMVPGQSFISEIEHLRRIYHISASSYAKQKRRLPYFIGAEFAHCLRSTANFKQIGYFTIDIDHIEHTDLSIDSLKKIFSIDAEVAMCFTSPGGNGLKLLFRLSQPVDHTKRFSDFYKIYTGQFFKRHNFSNLADKQTSDVTRVCFLSYDPEAYFNPNAKGIDVCAYLNDIPYFLKENREKGESDMFKKNEKGKITADVYKKIKATLNPPAAPRPQKTYFVPEKLKLVDEFLPEKLKSVGFIQLKEVRPINYGKKYVFELNADFAEINVFYGKNGFSVVKTPKKGSHPELSDICVNILSELVYSDIPSMNALALPLVENNK